MEAPVCGVGGPSCRDDDAIVDFETPSETVDGFVPLADFVVVDVVAGVGVLVSMVCLVPSGGSLLWRRERPSVGIVASAAFRFDCRGMVR